MSRRSPFDDIGNVFDRMNRELEELGRQFEGEMGGGFDVDVVEYDDEIVVVADLPGFRSEDIQLAVAGRQLTLTAERDEQRDQGDARVHRHERRRRSVTRELRLPATVREEDASATYENGVLTVTLPKVEVGAEEGTRIDVE